MDYPDETYTDEEETQDNYYEEQRELWEDSQATLPGGKRSESLFSLFKDVWRTSDSSKVSNLDAREIGDLGISVRDCQRISLLSDVLHHPKFSSYFGDLSEITLTTAMSKKGWFVEIFVTSKKAAYKGSLTQNLSSQKPKWKIFGNKQQQQTQEE
jgi:hypothetical protein